MGTSGRGEDCTEGEEVGTAERGVVSFSVGNTGDEQLSGISKKDVRWIEENASEDKISGDEEINGEQSRDVEDMGSRFNENGDRDVNEEKSKSGNDDIKVKDVGGIIVWNVMRRTILSILMLLGFILLCLCNRVYTFLVVLLLTLIVMLEIIRIPRGEDASLLSAGPLALGLAFPLYFAVFFSVGGSIPLLHISLQMSRRLLFVCFYGYMCALVLFLMSLRKERLRERLGFFALIHFAACTQAVVAGCVLMNLTKGRFWVTFPLLLVVSNDIGAYIVGKCIGQRRLCWLSPRKTVEGVVGATIATAVSGVVLCHAYMLGVFPVYDKTGLEKKMSLWCFGYRWNLPEIYVHSVPLVLAACVVAPFGGLLGSALKRAYGRKDFGRAIPGHGGITDRFDCHEIMVVFTCVYVHAFV